MRKILLSFLLFALPCLAQDSFQTVDGSTNGTAVSSATLALGANGTGTGTWGACSNTGADFFHSQAFQMPFPGLQAAAGTKFSGGGTTGLQYTLRAAGPFPGCSYSGFTSTTSIAAIFMFKANFDSTGDTGHQESNFQIINGGGLDYMILLHINGLLKLESHCNSCNGGGAGNDGSAGVVYHGGPPVVVSMFYKVGSAFTMSIYDSTCTLIGVQQVSPFHPTNNPGLVGLGISGAESEPSGGGNAIGWDNAIVKEGATSEIACGDATSLSSGVIAPTRSTDNWKTAGVTGGIPSATWLQCGGTISPFTGSAAAINTAISGCGANQFVLLGNGTFNLSSGIAFPSNKNNVALRGGGANSTFLVFTASAAGSTKISANGSTSYTTAVAWTNGYAQGATKVKLASIPGGVVVGSIIRLAQCDDGYTGTPCTGTSTDNGQLFNCSSIYSAPNGCSSSGTNCPVVQACQEERHIVAGISGTTVILQDGLEHPNWNPGQSPIAQFITVPLAFVGIENLSVDSTGLGVGSSLSDVLIKGARDSWISGIRVVNAQEFCLGNSNTDHVTVMSNYCAFSQVVPPGATHALAQDNIGHALTVNNIFQGFDAALHTEQTRNGNVAAYNFIVNMLNAADLMGDGIRNHSSGSGYDLEEGNVVNRWYMDDIHGAPVVETIYRNLLTGWESCATSGTCGGNPATVKDSATNGVDGDAYTRYFNIAANVIGTPGFHNVYKNISGANKVAVTLGSSVGAVPSDPLSASTALFWGNYDVVTAAVRWCGNSSNTGWSNALICNSISEVPTGAVLYPNPVPTKGDTGGALPASFAFSSKPAFFQSLAWPPIGPDVTSGNIGLCSGSLNVAGQFNGLAALSNLQCLSHGLTASAWGGHVNAIPAMNCALAVMGMPPDGTGSPLAFDASTCYGGQVAPPTFTPSAGTYPSIQAVTVNDATPGATILYCFDLTNTCNPTSTYSSPVSVASFGYLRSYATASGYTDSVVASSEYFIIGPPTCLTISGIDKISGLDKIGCQ